VLAEQHDEWTEGRRYLGIDVLARRRIQPRSPSWAPSGGGSRGTGGVIPRGARVCCACRSPRARHGAEAGQAPRVETAARGAARCWGGYLRGANRATVACEH
jgi:hypothetical protein